MHFLPTTYFISLLWYLVIFIHVFNFPRDAVLVYSLQITKLWLLIVKIIVSQTLCFNQHRKVFCFVAYVVYSVGWMGDRPVLSPLSMQDNADKWAHNPYPEWDSKSRSQGSFVSRQCHHWDKLYDNIQFSLSCYTDMLNALNLLN